MAPTEKPENVDARLIQAQLAKLRAEQKEKPPAKKPKKGTGPPHMPPMDDERLGRLEGAVDGLKRVQDLTAWAVLGVGALLLAISLYSLTRLDQLGDRVAELPSKVSSELRDITKTLAESITAAKQQQPQIILMPPPVLPPAPSPPTPNNP